jgi:hypothetical protein
MKPTRKRLVGIAAALSTVAIAAPVSTASAATTASVPFAASLGGVTGPGPFAAGWGGAIGFPYGGGPLLGQSAAVIGPTIITTAPSLFINTNNQVSAGSSVSGGQFGP